MAHADPYILTAGNTDVPASTTRYDADGSVLQPWAFDPSTLRKTGTALVEIPILNPPTTVAFDLPGRSVRLRLTYNDVGENSCWIMDIGDAGGAPLAHGIPLLPGLDLLEPYSYLGLGARLFVIGSPDPSGVPSYADLGTSAKLYAEVPT